MAFRFLLLALLLIPAVLMIGSAKAEAPASQVSAPWSDEDTEENSTENEKTPPAKITPAPAEEDNPSILEDAYSERVVDEVEQFGYDLFGVPRAETQKKLDHIASMPMGAVQDDFILDFGDEIEVVFSGQRTDRDIYTVNSEGLLLIPDFPPIPAAGRSIGQVKISIESAAINLHNTQTYVSLASVRQIGVLVVGHVKKPGRQSLTVFHTVLDALMEAGGIDKTGSLRQIKLVRHGRGTIIDLYGLLMHGSTNMDISLRDGDRIIIPPLGPTIAVAGDVKRPGIYEILTAVKGMRHEPENASEKLSMNEVLDYAGGVLTPGQNRFLRLDVTNDGHEDVTEIHKPFDPLFGDGAILMVSRGDEKRAGTVELTGHTRREGLHALDQVTTLSALLDNEQALGPDIYPLIGVIERWDSSQLASMLLDFPPLLVLKGEFDRKLEDGDVVHLFSKKQIESLSDEKDKPKIEKVALGSTPGETEDNTVEDRAIASFLKERAAFVRGAVRSEGAYPVAEGTTLDSVLAIAGGLALEANTSNIEVTSAGEGKRREKVNFTETSPTDVAIGAGDSIRVGQKFQKIEDKSVLVIGEVLNPGRYDLSPGDKVSDLVRRAGGLNNQAYPEGAVFSREAERRAEESRFRAAARDMERAIAVAIEQEGEKRPNADQLSLARDLAVELREAEALGRITVEVNPGELAINPALDMLLEPGDRLYIPKRPLTVRVSGEVLSPASLQFRSDKDPVDYIDEAGGFTFHADKDRTFVLYPDGSAQPLQVSAWNHKAAFIPPGSTIIIPRDSKPFDFIESAKDISQILSNLAITSIFIDDVRDDNDD